MKYFSQYNFVTLLNNARVHLRYRYGKLVGGSKVAAKEDARVLRRFL